MVKRKYSSKRSGLRGRGDYSFGPYKYTGRTPFAEAGKVIGSAVGWPKVGEGVGHVVGRLFGSGDYKMGYSPTSNSLWNSTQTPKFATNGRGNIITNREYVTDIIIPESTSAGAFIPNAFTINPGLASTFPWLATISQQYEQYKIHGMIFEFKSTLGDNSGVQNVGTVIMSTEYNVNAGNYANKQVMENAEFAQSGKATESMIHGIECAGKEHPLKLLFTKTNTQALGAGDSTKWYDFANFQIATVGFPATAVGQTLNIGELWVSYQIEFFKPQIPSNIGGAVQTVHQSRTACSPADYFGLASTSSGTLGLVCSGAVATITGLYVGNTYVATWMYIGTAAAVTQMNTTHTGLIAKNLFNGPAAGGRSGGIGGALCTTSSNQLFFTATAKTATITVTGGVIPGNSVLDFFVTGIDNSITN